MSGKNKGIRKGASFSLIHKLCEYQAVRKLAETKGYPVRQMCRCLGHRSANMALPFFLPRRQPDQRSGLFCQKFVLMVNNGKLP